MKNIKPIYIILIGSIFVTLITYIGILLSKRLSLFGQYEAIGLGILSGISASIIFYLLIKLFITEKLKVLYNISLGKLHKQSKQSSFKINSNPNKEAEIATQKWSEGKNLEISKLKKQEEFRREFLGNIAHELKTPVFSIQGYILTLLDGGLEDKDVNRLFLERASKATERMTLLLNDLDHITQLEVNQMKLNKSEFDIVSLIEDVFEELEIKANKKEIKLSLVKEYGIIRVFADRVKISQVLTNLISNSISYGNEKGRTEISIQKNGNKISINVQDNGPGIAIEELPRLFERFYRVEKSRNRNQGGSGLGLAIVKHIIEAHEQTISVVSTINKGSTFTFSLDRSKAIKRKQAI